MSHTPVFTNVTEPKAFDVTPSKLAKRIEALEKRVSELEKGDSNGVDRTVSGGRK